MIALKILLHEFQKSTCIMQKEREKPISWILWRVSPYCCEFDWRVCQTWCNMPSKIFLSYSTFQNIFERLILLFLSDYTKVLFLLCACNTFWWSIWINMIEIEILFIVMLSQYIIKKNITLYHKVYNQNVSGYFDINTMKMLFILSSEIIVEMRNLWNICLSHLVNKLTKTELCHRLKSHYHNEAHIDPEPMRRK